MMTDDMEAKQSIALALFTKLADAKFTRIGSTLEETTEKEKLTAGEMQTPAMSLK